MKQSDTASETAKAIVADAVDVYVLPSGNLVHRVRNVEHLETRIAQAIRNAGAPPDRGEPVARPRRPKVSAPSLPHIPIIPRPQGAGA